MDRKQIIAIGVASLAALGAAFVAKDFIAAKPQPVKTKVVDRVEKTEVLVVTKNVQMGERLHPGLLRWAPWPKETLLPGMITRADQPDAMDPDSPDSLIDARVRTPMVAGEPVLENKVMRKGEGGLMSALLPKGMRALAVKITVESASGGFIMPNDRVDVLLTRRLNEQTFTDTVLENVRVLAIDQKYVADDSDTPAVSTVETATLEVTPEQARVLTRVQSIGELSLALRALAERGDGDLKDDKPRLTPQFARNAGGEIRVFRYGVMGSQPAVN